MSHVYSVLYVQFNPRTAFRGPFGPQTMLTVNIFVIGLIYLLFIFVIFYNTNSFWNDIVFSRCLYDYDGYA